MYQNKVTSSDSSAVMQKFATPTTAASPPSRSRPSPPTRTRDGQYVSHTEWHRCVVFGKLSEFAGTLTKGAHVQVEGELRSREYDSKKTDSKRRIWEIRVDSILKLDRAEKAAPEDQEHDESPGGNGRIGPCPSLLEARLRAGLPSS